MEILKIVAGIVVFCLIVYFLFYNFWISRICSIGCCVYLIVTSMGNAAEARVEMFWTYVFVSVFAWLFYRGGSNVFDAHENGLVDVYSDGTRINQIEGGFIQHAALSGIFMAVVYGLIAPGTQFMYFLVPIVIIGLNAFLVAVRLGVIK